MICLLKAGILAKTKHLKCVENSLDSETGFDILVSDNTTSCVYIHVSCIPVVCCDGE